MYFAFYVLLLISPIIIYKILAKKDDKGYVKKSKLFSYALILSVVHFLFLSIDGLEMFLSFLASVSYCFVVFVIMWLLSPHFDTAMKISVIMLLSGFQFIFHLGLDVFIPKLAYIEADSPLAESIENHLNFKFPDDMEGDITLIYDGFTGYGDAYEVSFELTPESFKESKNKFEGEDRHFHTVILENNNVLVRLYVYSPIYSYFESEPANNATVPIGEILQEVTAWEYLKHNVLN